MIEKSFPELQGTIISTPMKAVEERIVEQKLSQEPKRYKPDGHQSRSRKLRSSPGTICYHFTQLVDHKENPTFAPLAEELSIPSYGHILEEATEGPIGSDHPRLLS